MMRGGDGCVGGGIYSTETLVAARRKARSSGHLIVADVHVGRVMPMEISKSSNRELIQAGATAFVVTTLGPW